MQEEFEGNMRAYIALFKFAVLVTCVLLLAFLVVLGSNYQVKAKLFSFNYSNIETEARVSTQRMLYNNTMFAHGRKSAHENNSRVPTCTEYYKTIRGEFSRMTLVNMYVPGECSLFSPSDKDAQRIPGPWAGHELWQQCRGRRRLCYGMPEVFRLNRMVQRYGMNTAASVRAYRELGSNCFNSKLAIFASPRLALVGGGPRVVVNNLLSGLRLIGKVYHFNPHDLILYDYMLSIDYRYEFLLYSFTEEDRPWRFYFGPIIKAYNKNSQDNLHKITQASRNHVHIVASSIFAARKKFQYVPAYPMKRENVVIIASGVDTDMFKPSKAYVERQPPVCLFYYKKRKYLKLAQQLEREAKELNYSIVRITYGNYTEDYFISVLQKVRFAVIVDSAETQGMANLEIMAMDVPVFVMYRLSVQYFHDSVGVIYDPHKPDSVTIQFLNFHNHVMNGTYKPREWILNNFDLVSAAINTMKVFCRNERPFDKYMMDNFPQNLKKRAKSKPKSHNNE